MGKVVDIGFGGSGVTCLYKFAGGMIYSECAHEDGEFYLFLCEYSCIMVPLPTGQMAWQRMDKAMGKPKQARIPKIGVISTDCTDKAVSDAAHQEMSGIVLVGPGAKITPGETAH